VTGTCSTVGAQRIACAQSIAHSQIGDNICKKKPNFVKLFLQEMKRVIQQHILEQKPTFLALKVENSHVSKKLFLFFVKISPGDFFGIGEFSPTLNPASKRSL
jgi:hypothetical protein